jgi:hypothetical protein
VRSALLAYLHKLLRAVAISACVATLTALVAFVASYLLYPVTGTEVKGANMLPESEAREAVPEYASLLSLNEGAVVRRVKSNPWVKDARVLKDWDSGIVTIEVEERKAVLYGNLDGRQVMYAADGTELPELGGEDLKRVDLDEAQLEEVLSIGEALDSDGITLDSVDGSGAGGITATVEGYRVFFADSVGNGQVLALKDLLEKHTEAAYLDLRSPGRIVIPESSSGENGARPESSGG